MSQEFIGQARPICPIVGQTANKEVEVLSGTYLVTTNFGSGGRMAAENVTQTSVPWKPG